MPTGNTIPSVTGIDYSWSVTDIPAIPLSELTQNDILGEGAFDVLMSATSKHLEKEFRANRIRGQDYATVYTSALTEVMNIANAFVLQKRKAALEARMVEAQAKLAEAQLEKIPLELEILNAEVDLAKENLLLVKEQVLLAKEQMKKQPHEIKILEEQAKKIAQEVLNLECEQQLCQANILNVKQQTANLLLTADNIPKQGCVLDAEFDSHKANIDRISGETLLIEQKRITELAQVNGLNVDPDSVIGRQKALYAAQTKGFEQDAKMKFAKMMVDSWSVRASTDTGTEANDINKLFDPSIGEALDIAKASLG